MAEYGTPSPRILVAIDASAYGLAALETAVQLAADASITLEGLFVEDINLLRLASLPFAQEVAYGSPTPRRVELAAIERSLQATAQQVRRALEGMCHGVSVQWSFTVARGPVIRTALAAASHADLLLIGRQGPAQDVAPRRPGRAAGGNPIVAAFDGSASGQRVLEAAAQWARQGDRSIAVVLADFKPRSTDEIRSTCAEWLERQNTRAFVDRKTVSSPLDLLRAAQRWHAGLLLINRDSPFLDERAIDQLITRLDCPLGLVR